MSRRNAILFVNPWEGIIGPNVGMRQFAGEAVRRGIDTHVLLQRREDYLADLADQGVAFHYDPDLAKTPRSLNPLRQFGHLVSAWRCASRIGRLARELGARSIVINSENMLLAPRAGKIAGCPTVCIMRGMRFVELGAAGKVYFGLQQRLITRYLAIIRIGARELASLGVDAGKIVVIHNGTNVDSFAPGPRPEHLAREFGIAPEHAVIVCVAHLTPRKGAHHVVELARLLAPRVPHLRWILVGGASGSERDYADSVTGRARELGLEDRLTFAGYRKDLADLYRLADIVVHPSETECCPRSVIEAQACGRPLVGFRVGGMPEVVSDGRSGLLFELPDVAAMADAVAALLDDDQRRAKMAAEARQWALEHFDLRRNLAAALDLFCDPAAAAPTPLGETTVE